MILNKYTPKAWQRLKKLFEFQEEIARLRVDKLELLRQILSIQHEVRRLQDRETQLQSDLSMAGKEIRRLKFGVKVEAAAPVGADSTKTEL